mmetsp:Transcript_11810/g.11452  ORF Transcript_11810/g.11452 Transcript_11810/m.11452 type:complete len:131 (+) Transcript_11810:121-513(+)|eukprot:CAMPEP_0119036366 /NCGR_PEP_ID=MMETSP1177-20130426/4058_1 /TAXON_ID=2985 /ORGANISM="Ochromonas sp, Strain CCMP1899" /LENGTH=130 /DNA_ID=CAMNT_0006996163 /DNA_START=113 /DNA_END=505 /DNA_ORIENTATION=-
MAAVGASQDVEETIKELKKIPGFNAYLILNNDGIVIKYENMSYKGALHHANQILGLTGKATKYIKELFDAPDNEVESIRLRTTDYEMIIAQHGNFTVIVTQDRDPSAEKNDGKGVPSEEKKGEEEKKEAA